VNEDKKANWKEKAKLTKSQNHQQINPKP